MITARQVADHFNTNLETPLGKAIIVIAVDHWDKDTIFEKILNTKCWTKAIMYIHSLANRLRIAEKMNVILT